MHCDVADCGMTRVWKVVWMKMQQEKGCGSQAAPLCMIGFASARRVVIQFMLHQRRPWAAAHQMQTCQSHLSHPAAPHALLPAFSRPNHSSSVNPFPGTACSAASRTAPTPAGAQPGVGSTGGKGGSDGIRFVYEHPGKRLKLKTNRNQGKPTDVAPRVDVMIEGALPGWDNSKLEDLAEKVGMDAGQVMRQALLNKGQAEPKFKLPRTATLSLVLCDDPYIRALNYQHRNKDAPTDVLSFEMGDELAYKLHLPVMLLGDIVVSLDTAQRQADERGHSLHDEMRVLLVHGILHLCGFDHEKGDAEAKTMADEEARVMATLGWKGQGLIAAQTELGEREEAEAGAREGKGKGNEQGGDTGAGKVKGTQGKTGGQDRTGSAGASGKERDQGGKGGDGGNPAGSAAAGQVGLGSLWVAAGMGTGSSQGRDEPSSSGVIRRAAVAAAARDKGKAGAAVPNAGAQRGSSNQAGSAAASNRSKKASPSTSSQSAPTAAAATAASPSSPASPSSSPPSPSAAQPSRAQRRTSDIRLVALDMDGTLLDSRSQIRPSSAAAIRAACAKGVSVILATGKARPAALAAARKFGLEGDRLLVSPRGPGIFLQGLAVHGRDGSQLSDSVLPASVVQAAFEYAESSGGRISACAFLGDECATLRMTPGLKELHDVYYEPLAAVRPSMEALLSGPPVKKVLFMAQPSEVTDELLPEWTRVIAASSTGATVLQAVPNMLELVPHGINKWVGAQVLLRSLGVPAKGFMAVGDGGNDYELVANAGVGVAMGNAVASVKAAAACVVGSHDEDGIAEAFERFVL